MKRGALVLLLAGSFGLAQSPAATAESYLDLGVGPTRGVQLVDNGQASELFGPFAKVELGYRYPTSFGALSVSWLHVSSLTTNKDQGLDWLGVSYKLTSDDVMRAYRTLTE